MSACPSQIPRHSQASHSYVLYSMHNAYKISPSSFSLESSLVICSGWILEASLDDLSLPPLSSQNPSLLTKNLLTSIHILLRYQPLSDVMRCISSTGCQMTFRFLFQFLICYSSDGLGAKDKNSAVGCLHFFNNILQSPCYIE